MPIAVSQTMEALCEVVQSLPIGTNLALLQFLWMQLSGALLPSGYCPIAVDLTAYARATSEKGLRH